MKLNKDNKKMVQVGDCLRFGSDCYLVVNVITWERGGISYTLQNVNTKQTIYCQPSSECYGAEWVKNPNRYESFEVFIGPKDPHEKGTYIGKTPILEQAEKALDNIAKLGNVGFIVGVKADGERVYL